jgi:hypothetical protein
MTKDNMPKSEGDDDNLDDFLPDLDMSPMEESNEELLAAIGDLSPEVAFEAPSVPKATPGWLTDAQEYAVKHGPFSSDQIVTIIRILHAIPDPTVESAQ